MKTTFKDKLKKAKGTKNISKETVIPNSNFKKGLWDKSMLKIAVKKGKLTALQYEEITGEKLV